MELKRVQALANGNIEEIPNQFIREANERPENSKAVEGASVPVISLSQPHDVLVDEIYKACSEWGFFILKDHGVKPSLIRRLKEVGQEFFRVPQEEREAYANDPSGGKFEGYGTKMMTKKNDQKLEWVDYYFHLMAPPFKVTYDLWPKNPPPYRLVTEEYKEEILKVADKLLGLLSEGIGLKENVLRSCLGGGELELEMKINMYPPCPQPELVLGVEPHTDMSALTLLVPNDIPGLQVWKDGKWIAVDYLPDSIFVHVGDQIEVLSNGKYKSILHRSLVNKERTRMSWAVFCGPPHEAVIGPLQQLVDDQNPPKYTTKSYAEFRHCKFNNLPQ